MYKMYFLTLVLFSFYSFAETDSIIITADRIKTKASLISSQTFFVSSEVFDQSGNLSIEDVLKKKGNFNILTSGSFGNSSSMFLRGAEASHTLVVLDGILLNDPSNPNRSFDFSKISMNNIEKIEILKGSQGLLYGSNAIGGVVLLTSKKKASKKYSSEVSILFGSYNTSLLSISTNQAIGNNNLSFSAEHLNSDGFSSASDSTHPNDKDGVFKQNYSMGFSGELDKTTKFDIRAHIVSDKIDLDKGGGDNSDDPNYKGKSQEIFSKIELNKEWTELFLSKFLYSYTNYLRRNYDPTDAYQTYDASSFSRGSVQNFSIDNNIQATNSLAYNLNFGIIKEEDSNRSAISENLFLYFKNEHNDYVFNAGLRLDHYEVFGEHLTYKFGVSKVLSNITIRSTLSSGFRAPSLNQLYDKTYGNKNLSPETSQSADLGIDYENGKLNTSTSVFYSYLKNRLSYHPTTFINRNAGRAFTKGLEQSLHYKITEELTNHFLFNLTEAFNLNDGTRLPRRAEIQLTNNLEYSLNKNSFNIENIYYGNRPDVDNNGLAKKVKKAFLTNLEYIFKPNELSRVSLKFKNLFNTNYQEIWGYNTGGRIITLSYLTKF